MRSTPKKSLLKSGSLLTLGLISSKVISYITSYLIASRFGASLASDQTLFIFTLPDFVTTLLFANFAEIHLTPFFVDKNKDHNQILKKSLWGFVLLSVLITFIFHLLSDRIYLKLVPGFADSFKHISNLSSLLILMSIFILPLTKPLRTLLSAHSKYLAPAFEVVVFNLCFCLYFLITKQFSLEIAILILSIASLIRFLFLFLPAIKQTKQHLKTSLPLSASQPVFPIKESSILYFQCILLTAAAVIIPTMLKSAVSQLQVGSYSIFTYAYKLAELPLGVWGVITTSLFLPQFFSTRSSIKIFKKWFFFALILGILSFTSIYFAEFFIFKNSFSIKSLNEQDIKEIFLLLKFMSVGISMRFLSVLLQLFFLSGKNNKLLLCVQILTFVCAYILITNTQVNSLTNAANLYSSIFIAEALLYFLACAYHFKDQIINLFRRT